MEIPACVLLVRVFMCKRIVMMIGSPVHFNFKQSVPYSVAEQRSAVQKKFLHDSEVRRREAHSNFLESLLIA
jgi:hypothetical protein